MTFSNLSPSAVQSKGELGNLQPKVKQSQGQRHDKRQIEQRIEEDRERHKRLRERIWAITAADDKEFQKLWEESSVIGDDDYLIAEEESNERQKAFQYQRAEMC